MQFSGRSSSFLNNVTKGVPRGSIIGSTLFTIDVNDVGQNINASVHLSPNDTIVHCCASTVAQTFEHLQSAFDTIQSHLFHLRLVLNADTTKAMFFSNKKKVAVVLLCIMSAQGTPIEIQIFKHHN